MLTRILLVAIALPALCWVAILTRDQVVGQPALDRLEAQVNASGTELRRDLRRLRDADLLTPDTTWRIGEAKVWLRGFQPRRAAAAAERVVAAEPESYEAWGLLYAATHSIDRRRAAQALARMERLNPLAVRSAG
ncbi:MAG TPA: hypothetical protein VFD37_07145 [Solirubrobacterales bacterium]|nr:hypothetical protein [Solirubrobacterales bacterium]